jgi:hypothetical protein
MAPAAPPPPRAAAPAGCACARPCRPGSRPARSCPAPTPLSVLDLCACNLRGMEEEGPCGGTSSTAAATSRRSSRLAPLPRARAARRLRLRPRRLRHPDDPPPSSSVIPGSLPHQALAAAPRVRAHRSRPGRLHHHALGQILSPVAAAVSWRSEPLSASLPAPVADVSHQSTTRAPRCSAQLRRLHIELPTGELSTDDGVLLKWKANFGSTLGSCVILGTASVSSKPPTGP